MGNWFELGYTEMEADPNTFVVLSRDFGKDKQRIFWKGKAQPVDHKSFRIDEQDIPKDAIHVYYIPGYGNELSIVEGANPDTYQVFKLENETYSQQWAKDHQFVFLYGKKVDADGKTFVRINQSLAVDSLYLYTIVYDYNAGSGSAEDNTKVIRKKERPTGAVESINDYYARIGNVIILSNWKNEFSQLNFQKIDTISALNERNIIVNTVLVSDGKLMPEVDVTSLEIIDRDFLKDKNAVYYDTEKIREAEPATFSTISEVYAKDQLHVFYKTQLLLNANPASFTVNYATGIASDGKLSFKDGVLVKN